MRKVLFLFGQLTDNDVLWLSSTGERRNVAEAFELIKEGEPTDELFIVLSGELEILVDGTTICYELLAWEFGS